MEKAVKTQTSFPETPIYKPDPLFVQAPVGWTKMPEKGGLGTVALHDIPKGTIIERSTLIIMPVAELKRPDGSEIELGSYAFHWGPEEDKESTMCAIVKGGLLALANHSSMPNSDIKQDHAEKLITWFATRDIKKGEEVTIDYDTELWFENREENPA